MERVRGRIVPPQFPDREFDILAYGASADGQSDSGQAINAAIEACNAAGGGRVIVPPGLYNSGPIRLLSNVNLHLVAGATISFCTDPLQYLPAVPTRWEGIDMLNFSPLIYAYRQTNVAITGSGCLNGSADEQHWWPWKGPWEHLFGDIEDNQNVARARLFGMGEQNISLEKRVFGPSDKLRPSFVQPYACRNVLIEGITITSAPFWQIHPVYCRNVTVRDVSVSSHGPNNDGCNPDSCQDVLIERCTFDTGDDCVAIKSGRNADGRRVSNPCQNIVISDCDMHAGHGGVVIGSEMSGGVRNVYVDNCRMSSPNLWYAIRIKTNSVRGGFVENLHVRNLNIGTVERAVIRINFNYGEGDVGTFLPSVENIFLEEIDGKNVRQVLSLNGYARNPIRNINLRNSQFTGVVEDDIVENVELITIQNVSTDRNPAV